MEYISVFIICLLSISIVRGEEDLTCKDGYGMIGTDIRRSGSQCSGLSKITTEAECKAAAEYNRKNNIDKSKGYQGRWSVSGAPPGCYQFGGYKYFWNPNTKSTGQCSNIYKCICKTKTCIKCPINSYSEGGINATCTSCPNHAPYTPANIDTYHSINVCSKKKDEIYCDAGFDGFDYRNKTTHNQYDPKPRRTSGQCIHKITTEEGCKAAAMHNKKTNVDNNNGYSFRHSVPYFPPGCYQRSNKKYFFNSNLNSKSTCQSDEICICKPKKNK